MAHVFSTINLKGGVGKTTTTVALADFFSGTMHKRVLVIDLDPQTNATVMLIGEDRWLALNRAEHTIGKTTTTVALADFFSGTMHKRVLVIDLDPQTNATVMLIGEDRWLALNRAEHTIARLFKDALEPEAKRFDFDATLQRRVSNVHEAGTVDLLPSSLDLIDVQDRLVSVPSGRFYAVNPTELLWRVVKSRLDDYDVVIVDCPPNLGIITLNGLRISDGYIVPTIPDHLSTYGIPQI